VGETGSPNEKPVPAGWSMKIMDAFEFHEYGLSRVLAPSSFT
jgi:hypothetical protein